MEERGAIIQGVDVLDIVDFMDRKCRVYQAMTLSHLEDILDPDSQEFVYVRKLILDALNNYRRSVGRTLLGEVETGDHV